MALQLSCSVIHPEEVLDEIKNIQLEFSKADIAQATPITRLNLKNCVIHLVDNNYALIAGNNLILWRAQMTTDRGVYIRDAKKELGSFTFDTPVQRVCYIESPRFKNRPMLLVVTAVAIELMNFEPRGSGETLAVPRTGYNLTQITPSDFTPVELAAGEEVSWIGHVVKTDKVYYASHCDSYSRVYLKELALIDNTYKQDSKQKNRSLAADFQNYLTLKVAGVASNLVD